MAFSREQVTQPQAIGDIVIVIRSPDPTSQEVPSAKAHIQIQMSDGRLRTREVNLVDHLPTATINQLKTLAATIRTKANDEILPEVTP